jgi:hypothetical protein
MIKIFVVMTNSPYSLLVVGLAIQKLIIIVKDGKIIFLITLIFGLMVFVGKINSINKDFII